MGRVVTGQFRSGQALQFEEGYLAPVAAKYLHGLGVNFDGTNDYLTRGADLTGVSDGKEGIISFWLNMVGADGTNQAIAATGDLGTGFYIVRSSLNKMQVVGLDALNNIDLLAESTTSILNTSGWVHCLVSWDLASTTGWFYLSDVSDLNAGASTFNNDNIDWTRGNFAIGAEPDGGAKLGADIADLYINFATHLDLSITANRRLFIDASGNPVSLGRNGATPTGSKPAVFQSGTVSTWHINRGAGGGFTENGALTDAATDP